MVATTQCTEINAWQGGCSSVAGAAVCDPSNGEQRFIATAAQQLFTLTAFSYAPGTHSLTIHRNGLLVDPDNVQELSATTFWIQGEVLAAGDVIVANALTGVTAAVSVLVTNLFTAKATLADGQKAVPFPSTVPVTNSAIYISGPGVDSGRLVEDTNYTTDVTNNIINLIDSYPAGSILSLVYNDAGSTNTSLLELPANTVWHEFSSEIGTKQHLLLSTGGNIRTNYFDSTRTPETGASFIYTGIITIAKAGNTPDADGFFYDLDGKQFSIMGSHVYSITLAEDAANLTIVDIYKIPGDVLRYGFNTIPGTTDMQPAFNAAQLQMQQDTGVNILIPPGTYMLSSQWIVITPTTKRTKILAYGAELVGSGAYSGMQLTGGSTTGGCTVYGLQINHRGNLNATFGFELYQTWNARLVDCSVEAHGTAAGYAAYLLRNGVAADANTGCFWTTLDHCQNRRRSGADGTVVECAVRLRGAANATSIINCNFGDAVTCIHHTIELGQIAIANGLYVAGCAFEGYTTAYHLEGAITSTIGGIRFIGNRFESGTTVYSFTTTTNLPVTPPHFSGNHYVIGAGTILNNPNNLYMNIMDSSITPIVDPSEVNNGTRTIQSLLGSADTLDLIASGGARGLRIFDSSKAFIPVKLQWDGVTGFGTVRGHSNNTLHYNSARGISNTVTPAQNLRGTAILAAGTKAVIFPTVEADANYYIILTGNVNETFHHTLKTAGGFTITSSNGASVASVDWLLIR